MCGADLDGAPRLLSEARQEAAALIDTNGAGYRAAVDQLDGKIQGLQHKIGVRRAGAIAAFCHLHGLTVEWPSEHRGGIIRLPVMGLAPETYQEITASAATQPVPADPAETELTELRGRLLTMQILAEQPAAMALDMLVTRAQRKSK